MHVRDVAAGEQERDAIDAVERLHHPRDLLSKQRDRRNDPGWRFVEIGKVLLGYDLGVAGPDRAAVQEGEEMFVFMNDMRLHLAFRDPTKRARRRHVRLVGSERPGLPLRIVHTTRLPRPQLLSEAQMPRSSRKRSMGAELASARMR